MLKAALAWAGGSVLSLGNNLFTPSVTEVIQPSQFVVGIA